MQRLIFLLCASLILSCASECRGSIYWDGSAAAPTSGSVANASVGLLSRNNNNGTTTMITSASASSGYTGSSGTQNFGAAAKITAFSTANSTYFSVTLTPVSGYQITLDSISLGSRSTSTGPTVLSFYSGIDNFATAIGTAPVIANGSWALSSVSFSGSSLTGSDGLPIEFRIYGSGGGGSPSAGTANWRIDDINLTFSATAVPEPSTFVAGALLALPFGVQGVRYLRNRKRA